MTGAAFFSKSYQLPETLKTTFQRGLIRAARKTSAWIVTGGTQAGVMELVGQTVRESKGRDDIVCLGIASWGALRGHHELECAPNGAISSYSKPSCAPPGTKIGPGALIDPNHTHMILVDNGTEWEFGAEIKLRAELEDRLCLSSADTTGALP